MRTAIGRYRILGQLGEGGMGLVYDAWDDRLDRSVAVKVVRPETLDASGVRERFWREARSAGGLSHPNICHVYEIGEDDGELFIAMERLEGEPLDDRMKRGRLPSPEAVQIALGVLAGLEAVHARGLLHRDLKPSNVFLTPHGVKLLDFGLALPVATVGADASQTLPGLTLPGTVMGTPSYMAPEQVLAQPVDRRTDLYALGALLFEMLSGAPPFQAPTPVETLARIISERPPALGGSALVTAVDRVVHRALARVPDERYPDAASMAQDLRAALRVADSGGQPAAQPIRRLIVLPFRLLRPDTEIDFLAFGLADAIAASLMGESHLVVRSSLAAARYAGGAPDVSALAAEADVDLVMTGTLLRSGDQIRVTAQLAEAPRGTLLWTHTHQARLTDLFEVQDGIARQVCASVSASLGTRPALQAPRGRAHELYLRANQLALDPRRLRDARGCYEESVGEDPAFAPAWARLGRVYRVLAKYDPSNDAENFVRADRALKRALELDPELTMALTYYAQLEMDMGRSRDALVRLLERALRRPSDPYLLAGLVQAARYCGLVEVSIAAHEHARRLDPRIPTGVANTYWLKGDYVRVLDVLGDEPNLMRGLTLAAMGRMEEAIQSYATDEIRAQGTAEAEFATLSRLVCEGRYAEAEPRIVGMLASPTFLDPEALFHSTLGLVRMGSHDRATALLARAVERGFTGLPALHHLAWFDPLRSRPEFRTTVARAEEQKRAAMDAFIVAGGERVVGVTAG
jgi:TolB-like protein